MAGITGPMAVANPCWRNAATTTAMPTFKSSSRPTSARGRSRAAKNRFAIRLTPAEIRCQATRALLVLKSLGIICVIGFASAASAQNRYQITRIPTPAGANSAALGINNRGEVVGYSFQREDYQAFL